MIEYTVNYSNIINLVKEEVSKQAAYSAVGKDGESLYTAVMVFSRDDSALERYVDDAIGNITARLADICSYTQTTSSNKIVINAPDVIAANTNIIQNEIERYLSMYAVGVWLQDRLPSKAEMFLAIAKTALEKAVRLIKTRKVPA